MMPWSRGRRPVSMVVQMGGPSVGRSVASGPNVPRRARRASEGTRPPSGLSRRSAGTEAVDADHQHPPGGAQGVEADRGRRRRPAAARGAGPGAPPGRRPGPGRPGPRPGRAGLAGEEHEVEPDGEEDARPPPEIDDGGERQGAQRVHGDGVAVAQEVVPVEGGRRPPGSRRASEAKKGQPSTTERRGRGHHRTAAAPARPATRSPTRAHGGPGQEQAHREGQRPPAKSRSDGIEVEGEDAQAAPPRSRPPGPRSPAPARIIAPTA